jgi:hypothetical protein
VRTLFECTDGDATFGVGCPGPIYTYQRLPEWRTREPYGWLLFKLHALGEPDGTTAIRSLPSGGSCGRASDSRMSAPYLDEIADGLSPVLANCANEPTRIAKVDERHSMIGRKHGLLAEDSRIAANDFIERSLRFNQQAGSPASERDLASHARTPTRKSRIISG